ncbi:MAG: PTS sugar transporter subunit IIA [Spirochaetales bacterium]|nr:PTS sugar transporter subunit IIA [Spirochaetales bacterium]
MDLKTIFHEENCLVLHELSKTEALIEMMDNLLKTDKVTGEDDLKREIFYREQLMSTGIGMGIAVPHVRFKGVEQPVAALGICPGGIDDYESIDSEPVKLVIMIIVGENQHKQHIRLLAQIMERLKEPKQREALLKAESSKEIFSLISGESHA